MVTAGFDLVAVEIEGEGTVVVLVVMGTQARPAVVLAAGLQGRGVESVDVLAALRDEADVATAVRVGAAVQLLRQADPEARMIAADLAIAMGDNALAGDVYREDAGAADRGQHIVIEFLGAG